MVELDKVIAGLKYCVGPDTVCEDSDCPYHGKRDCDAGWVCVDFLMADALDLLKELSEDLRNCMDENHRLAKSLSITRLQRKQAWEKLARINGEKYAEWLEERKYPWKN